MALPKCEKVKVKHGEVGSNNSWTVGVSCAGICLCGNKERSHKRLVLMICWCEFLF